MKKRILLTAMLLMTALLLGGCAMRTIDELYTPPRRSQAYSNLQSVIDIAMAGMEYSAPLSGDNQQAVQTADLDGDGVEEYLVFAKGGMSEKPMQILIFRQSGRDSIQIEEVIATNGTAFDLVEYAQIDGKPGYELVVGRQVSNQLMKSAAVYSFANGRSFRLMNAGYSRLVTYDLGGSDQKELLMLQRGESEYDNAIAVLYRYRSRSMVRSLEVPLSQPADHIKRVTSGRLQCGTPAVYISSAMEDGAIMTDILMLQGEKFQNMAYQEETVGVQTLRNYYVYAEDVDSDGVIELPSLLLVKPMLVTWGQEEQHLIRWYSLDQDGNQTEKLISFHNYADGWYLELEQQWSERIKVYQVGSNYAFYMWDAEFEKAEPIFTIYTLSGSDRESQASQDGRFLLYHTEDVIYAARLENPELMPEITGAYLINSFHAIHQEWDMGAA